jgi:hypothetical protein
MSHIKLLLSLTAAVCIFAATTTPALALFEATTTGATTGPGAGGASVFTVGSGTFDSAKATLTWTIRDSKTEQKATKVGPHETLAIVFENITILGNPIDNVSCELELKQPNKGEAKATAAVVTPCVIKLENLGLTGCTITIPVAGNSTVTTNTMTKPTTTTVTIKAADTGITATTAAACASAGLSPGTVTNAELKGSTEQKGMQLV